MAALIQRNLSRKRSARVAGVAAAIVAATFFGAPVASAQVETAVGEFPAKPAGASGVISGAVGPGDYSLVIVFGSETGEEPITAIQGHCTKPTCGISTTPSAPPGEFLVRAVLTGTAPVLFEVA
jgi:hypothetical protein